MAAILPPRRRLGHIENTLAAVASRAFTEYEANNPVGYPLAWETLKEGLTQLLRQVTASDLKELSSSGFVPVSLETDMVRTLAGRLARAV